MNKTLKDGNESLRKLSEAIGLVIEVSKNVKELETNNAFHANRSLLAAMDHLTSAKKRIEHEEERIK